MLYREIIAVCSQIHTKHINTLCGQNVELLNVKLAVHIVTAELYKAFNYILHMKYSNIQITVPLFSLLAKQHKLKVIPANISASYMSIFPLFFPF